MEEDRKTPTTTPELQNGDNGETASFHDPNMYSDDINSTCSTPYISAPLSPIRCGGKGFFYSAPVRPMMRIEALKE
ncbi:hypothetical protein Acr_05g0000950 [Actinidia rufa]|uniref:Uncharacterized protein n=1 Tax=Actinidia rufa TaxID=165716 RepID=A0A7J0EJS0_9ERIC|nr:hypothetical protein Acr_05g0000950 [Actinidia rufa]